MSLLDKLQVIRYLIDLRLLHFQQQDNIDTLALSVFQAVHATTTQNDNVKHNSNFNVQIYLTSAICINNNRHRVRKVPSCIRNH